MGKKLLFKAAIAAAFAIGLVSTNAVALEKREVEAVVTILEQLSADTGQTVFYDEEAAQEWFEIDEESSQLIAAAGFTDTSWKNAFDQTMAGFIASMPSADRDEMEEKYAGKLNEAKMTPEQKQAAMEMLRAQLDKINAIRTRGAQYRGVVGPYAARLKLLSKQE